MHTNNEYFSQKCSVYCRLLCEISPEKSRILIRNNFIHKENDIQINGKFRAKFHVMQKINHI
jgi:hypothetical protein